MRALVTGAAGFLGRHYVDWLCAHDYDTIGVDDLSNARRPTDQMVRECYEFVEDDAADFLTTSRGTYDIAFHFAAPVGGRTKIEGDPLFNADSLRLDAAFFRWAVDHVPVAVYPSSSAVYGVMWQEGDGRALSEEMFHPSIPLWAAPDEMYGFTKMAGEVLAYKAEKYGLSTLAIRPFSGYGEGQGFEYPIPAICARALRRDDPIRVWGSGTQRRDFVHVSDLVAATFSRLDDGIHGYDSLNIGSGIPVSFVDVAQIAASIVGYEPEIITDPHKPEGVMSRYADVANLNRYYTPTITLKDGLARVLEGISVAESRTF